MKLYNSPTSWRRTVKKKKNVCRHTYTTGHRYTLNYYDSEENIEFPMTMKNESNTIQFNQSSPNLHLLYYTAGPQYLSDYYNYAGKSTMLFSNLVPSSRCSHTTLLFLYFSLSPSFSPKMRGLPAVKYLFSKTNPHPCPDPSGSGENQVVDTTNEHSPVGSNILSRRELVQSRSKWARIIRAN